MGDFIPMKISVLINNFNYGHFLDRAIQSVMAQKARVDEIIVVDDGSTDDSLAVLKNWADRDSRIQVVAKENGGQLSCFNAGFERCSGDIICFLDADDEYCPGYVSHLLETYEQRPEVDFVFCKRELINGEETLPEWEVKDGDFDFGITFLRAYFLREWLGKPTSAISMRRTLASKILPCALEKEWRICADNVLVFGAAAFFGRKFYLAEKCVRYHIHGRNHWYAMQEDVVLKMRTDMAVTNLLHHFNPGFQLVLDVSDDFSALFFQEFSTIPCPDFAEYKR